MAAQRDPGGLRRRADKLRFISWANLLVCVAAGFLLDFGEVALRWAALIGWSLVFLLVCHKRAAQMDRQGPTQRRQ